MPKQPKVLSFTEWLALQDDKYEVCQECGGTGKVDCDSCAIDCDGPNKDCDGTIECDECDGTGNSENQARRDYRQTVETQRRAWECWNQQGTR